MHQEMGIMNANIRMVCIMMKTIGFQSFRKHKIYIQGFFKGSVFNSTLDFVMDNVSKDEASVFIGHICLFVCALVNTHVCLLTYCFDDTKISLLLIQS